jgi:hypothetical protein
VARVAVDFVAGGDRGRVRAGADALTMAKKLTKAERLVQEQMLAMLGVGVRASGQVA